MTADSATFAAGNAGVHSATAGRRLAELLRALAVGAGLAVIAYALATALGAEPSADWLSWMWRVFGPVFAAAYLLLLGVHAYALRCVWRRHSPVFWQEAGQQAAAGMATLALTFTLLGISLGIGGLATAELSPETVREVIADLTARFSTAFMTTVVGLPTATIMRAVLALVAVRASGAGQNAGQ